MGTAYDFLDLYKRLEDTLQSRLKADDPRRGSVIVDFMNSPEGAPWKDRLNLCREIRNVMSHNADVDGEPVVVPSEAVVESLRSILEAASQPDPAMSYATPADKLLVAGPNDVVVPLMKKMEEKGFSHVPVISRGRITGVFSVSTVFSAGLQGRKFTLTEATRMSDFEALLPIDRHISERFRFMPVDATFAEVCAAFEWKPGAKKRRLAAVFLTDDGSQSGSLRGMLTPWDVLQGGPGAAGAERRN